MEFRPTRGRGGHWRRGGGAGDNDSGAGGERRGRGRGGNYRGRGKRDHYRGRGRGFSEAGAADCFRRGQDEQDNKENAEDEMQMPATYSRRKLESNWDRYEESEKEEVNDDIPVQRGTDYHVLLTSAGDSFTQFRFSEEKDWDVDSLGTKQVPALFVDLEALASSLHQLPLHQRLDLEPSLVQETTPVELPSVGVMNRVDPVLTGFKAPALAPAHSGQEPDSHRSQPAKPVPGTGEYLHTSTSVISPVDDADADADEELDLLLGLQKPVVTGISLANSNASNTVEQVSATSKKAAALVEDMEEQVLEVNQAEEEANKEQQKPEEVQKTSEPVKQEMTEEDLEDWLDSMIS